MEFIYTPYNPMFLFLAKPGFLPETEGATPTKIEQLIRESNGKLFTVTFFKRTNGNLRDMKARLGVKSYLKGGTLPFDPNDYNLIPVWDVDKKEYRMINLKGLVSLNIGGKSYSLTGSTQKALVKRIENDNLNKN